MCFVTLLFGLGFGGGGWFKNCNYKFILRGYEKAIHSKNPLVITPSSNLMERAITCYKIEMFIQKEYFNLKFYFRFL